MHQFFKFIFASMIRTEIQFRPDPARKLSANLYDTYHCCVCSKKTADDGQRNCPKHVEFYSKNKFEKLVHLVGFIIRIPHLLNIDIRNYLPFSSSFISYDNMEN